MSKENLKPYSLLILFLIVFNTTAWAQEEIPDPDPLRFESELDTFAEWDKRNSFPENAILFTGSSSIKGWETHLAFPELPIINRGFGGSHISDVSYYYERVIKKYAPALIVFYAGDNDIAAGKSVTRVFEDYINLTDRVLKDNPDTQFLFVSIKSSGSRIDKWELMNEVNQQVDEHSQANERLHYIDLASPLFDSQGLPESVFFQEDLLHLSKKGYQIWNETMRAELNSIFQKQ